MGFMRRKRFSQVIKFGWKDAKEIAAFDGVRKSRLMVFFDILSCFKKYYIFSNQYKNKKVWNLSEQERISLAETLGNQNRKKDQWVDTHYDDWKFLSKYTSLSWQETPEKTKKRKEAYRIHYGLGDNVDVQYGVTFICEHFSIGKITCGNNVLFARNVDIDYTGDLTIEDNVKISEFVKILTHVHELDFNQRDSLTHGLVKKPLVIRDNVGIGARSLIMPGVSEIGRGAMIAAGSIVKKQVPPYAIVMGNPARIVGFRYPPAIIAEYEEENYTADKRIPLETLEDNYNKYYLSKLAEIKTYLS